MACDCVDGPTPVTDWGRGDVVCCACGVVVEGHILDDCHVTFDDDDSNVKRRAAEAPELSRAAKRAKTLRDSREASLADGLRVVDDFVACMRQPVTGGIAHVARELFADLHQHKPVRSDFRRAAAAAALYYAFKLERAGRELKLVARVCGVDVRALNAATSEYKAALKHKPYYPRLFCTLQAGQLIDVFLDRLRLPAEQRRRAWRSAHQMDEALIETMDCGRKPRTISCGILYLAMRAENIDVGKKAVAEACDVCQQTLDKVANQIRQLLANCNT